MSGCGCFLCLAEDTQISPRLKLVSLIQAAQLRCCAASRGGGGGTWGLLGGNRSPLYSCNWSLFQIFRSKVTCRGPLIPSVDYTVRYTTCMVASNNPIPYTLKGLCHQCRIGWKWHGWIGLGLDIRHMLFKKVWLSFLVLTGFEVLRFTPHPFEFAVSIMNVDIKWLSAF